MIRLGVDGREFMQPFLFFPFRAAAWEWLFIMIFKARKPVSQEQRPA